MEKVVVLLVDDEEDFRFIPIAKIKQILKDQSFKFVEARDGEEALALLKRGVKPSMIILDYTLPKINGIELLRRIDSDHGDLCNVPRVMLSGYVDEKIVSEARRLRCDYFEKSIDTKIFYQQFCRYMAAKLGLSCV